jgi:hypothetical protein
MRPRIEPSNDLALSSPFRSWLDCITNTSGYDFRKGQVMLDALASILFLIYSPTATQTLSTSDKS